MYSIICHDGQYQSDCVFPIWSTLYKRPPFETESLQRRYVRPLPRAHETEDTTSKMGSMLDFLDLHEDRLRRLPGGERL